jgi:RNA polymerase sigma-70 factor (ECF subfamily)
MVPSTPDPQPADGRSGGSSAEGPGRAEPRAIDERELDHGLVRRAQRGDARAFEELVRRHERRVLRLARNLVPTPEDAQDLAQEAYLRVFRSLARFDFEHDFTTWLYRIVTNLAIDHLRKRRPTASTHPSEPDADGSRERPGLDPADESARQPGSELESAETARRVRACIDALAPHFRVVLTLRELEGLACTEIARIVGATHVTVRWRLHRGRKLFQEEWERRERLAEGAAFLAGEPQTDATLGDPIAHDEDPRRARRERHHD